MAAPRAISHAASAQRAAARWALGWEGAMCRRRNFSLARARRCFKQVAGCSRPGEKGGLEPPRLAALEPRRERGRLRPPNAPQRAWTLPGKGQAFAGAISPSLGLAVASNRPRVDRGLVRKGGLEPPRLAALEPKSRASTNSATFARSAILRRRRRELLSKPKKNARHAGRIGIWWAVKDSNLGPID
jgi:hypothetical protein